MTSEKLKSKLIMHFVHFADDTTVFATDSDIINVPATMNWGLVGVDNWLKTNRLSLNFRKTSFMIIFNQKNAFGIKIRESILTKVPTVKFLALHLMKSLKVSFSSNVTQGI